MKSKLPVPTAKDINEAHRLARKQAWVAEARKSFRPGERLWCGICDGYEDIAHAHHVLPLSRQFDLGVAVPDQDFVWLCPNHHIAVHVYLATGRLVLGCEKTWEKEKGWEEKGIVRVANMALSKEQQLLGRAA
jgi:hypothetical protein